MEESSNGNSRPDTIKGTGIALIVLTTVVVAARFGGSVRRFKDLKAEDFLLIVGYLFFLELSILYIYIAPVIFRIAAFQAGTIAPYATIMEDSRQLQIVFFVTTTSLWICLWMIKYSLLAMYKRLLVGKAYLIAWWTIVGFCTLVWIPWSVVNSLLTRSFSLLLVVFCHLGSPAPASMPGLQQGNVEPLGTNMPQSSAYILHTPWI